MGRSLRCRYHPQGTNSTVQYMRKTLTDRHIDTCRDSCYRAFFRCAAYTLCHEAGRLAEHSALTQSTFVALEIYDTSMIDRCV